MEFSQLFDTMMLLHVHVWVVSRLMKCARLVRMIMIHAPGWLRLGQKDTDEGLGACTELVNDEKCELISLSRFLAPDLA